MKKAFMFVWAFLLVSANTFAADKYIVILKEDTSMKTVVSVSNFKADLKKQTYDGIRELQMSVSPFSLYSLNTFQPSQVYWGIRGFSAYLSPNEVMSILASGKVESVFRDGVIKLDSEREPPENELSNYTYGLINIGVKDLNAMKPGIDGSGVVVGLIDSGVDASHPDLKGKILKFKDVVNRKTEPYDDNGHGTHCAGTIVGGNASGTQIGVAPGAKIYAAKVFSAQGYANDTDILEAMQWMLDPDDNPETDDAPAVVSNSWGGRQYERELEKSTYYKMIQTWIKAGIFPSFAAGNEGSRDGTMSVPGGLPDVYAVGATDSRNVIASFSSRGPITWKINGEDKSFIKPDISAPGVRVRSSVPGNKYADFSGTSMATPHVSGVIALMKQANPHLTVDELKVLISGTANKLGSESKNNVYGAGLINAKDAVLKALEK